MQPEVYSGKSVIIRYCLAVLRLWRMGPTGLIAINIAINKVPIGTVLIISRQSTGIPQLRENLITGYRSKVWGIMQIFLDVVYYHVGFAVILCLR